MLVGCHQKCSVQTHIQLVVNEKYLGSAEKVIFV